MILALTRHIATAYVSLKSGRWEPGGFQGMELHGKTLGWSGSGPSARRWPGLGAGIGMKLVGWTRNATPDRARHGLALVPLPEVFSRSDVVSIHLSLRPETEHLVSRALLSRMKPEAYFVNTARAKIVDNAALADLLRAGGSRARRSTCSTRSRCRPALRVPRPAERARHAPHRLQHARGEPQHAEHRHRDDRRALEGRAAPRRQPRGVPAPGGTLSPVCPRPVPLRDRLAPTPGPSTPRALAARLRAARAAGWSAVELRRIDFARAAEAGQPAEAVLDLVRGAACPSRASAASWVGCSATAPSSGACSTPSPSRAVGRGARRARR